MIEVNALMFTIISSALVLVLIILVVVFTIALLKIRCEKQAAKQLVGQIQNQSKIRLEETGSYLQDSYQLSDEELAKAIKIIDKSEKKLIQKIINMYVNRDHAQLPSIDSWVAELVAVYKQLKPAENNVEMDKEITEELREQLEEALIKNERLTEELGITKETMANMIAEFGNMFGGGSEHELAKHEVVGRVQDTSDETTEDALENSDLLLDELDNKNQANENAQADVDLDKNLDLSDS